MRKRRGKSKPRPKQLIGPFSKTEELKNFNAYVI